MWQPIETYKPANQTEDENLVLLYSPKAGIQIGSGQIYDEDEGEIEFHFSSESWRIYPTHWMPLPSIPEK